MEKYLIPVICIGSILLAGVFLCLLVQCLVRRRREGAWLIQQFRVETLIIVQGHNRGGYRPNVYRLYGALPELMRGSIIHVIISAFPQKAYEIDGFRMILNFPYARAFEEQAGFVTQVSNTSKDGDTTKKAARANMSAICLVLHLMPRPQETA